MSFYLRKKRHFRGHVTSKGTHPAYIVGENRSVYLYFGLTHSKKKGKGHSNYRLSRNPKKGDSSVAYLRKSMGEDDKRQFTKSPFIDYKMSDEDDEMADRLITKKRK